MVEDFIFPASRLVTQCRKSDAEFPTEQAVPVCSSSHTVVAAYDLLVALCMDCVLNLKYLSNMIIEMYYTGNIFTSLSHFIELIIWESCAVHHP